MSEIPGGPRGVAAGADAATAVAATVTATAAADVTATADAMVTARRGRSTVADRTGEQRETSERMVIFDLGTGNLSSVALGLTRAGMRSDTVGTIAEWAEVSRSHPPIGAVLPGVGAFGDAMFQLRASGLLETVRAVAKTGLPVLGICLGMQLLFTASEEHGRHVGIGLLRGRIVRFPAGPKVPHMGWNDLVTVTSHPLLAGVSRADCVYFVHSYYAQVETDACVLASARYGGIDVPAVVGQGNVFGTQFHPEKSGAVGGRILANFVQICRDRQTGGEAQ